MIFEGSMTFRTRPLTLERLSAPLQTPGSASGRGARHRSEALRAPVLTYGLMLQTWTPAAISSATCVNLARAIQDVIRNNEIKLGSRHGNFDTAPVGSFCARLARISAA